MIIQRRLCKIWNKETIHSLKVCNINEKDCLILFQASSVHYIPLNRILSHLIFFLFSLFKN